MIRLAIVLFLVLAGCSTQTQEQGNPQKLSAPVMPTTVLNAAFLVVNGVYNSELIAPMDVFHHTTFHTEKGMKVFTVASQRDTIVTFEGLKLIPDFAFSTDSIPPIDILIVPSAEHSMDSDLKDEALIEFVKTKGRDAFYIMSLCDGAFVLAKAGLLDTYQCTTFPDDIASFEKAFPKLKVHRNVSFVHDRKVITSAGGVKSYEAALYLVELLYGGDVAKRIGKGLVIDWDIGSVDHISTNY
jgi:transcriptional regulator GlxA family with amidase domain